MNKNLKPIITFVAVFMFRLIPVRPPNVEPILATILPLSKKYNALSAVVFSVLSIVLYDMVTAGIGLYTWTTSLAYAFVAVSASIYFARRELTVSRSIGFSILGVLFYDVMTGVVMGPLITGTSMAVALIGQIPFTMLHMMGAVGFALILTPLLARWYDTEDHLNTVNATNLALK